MSAGSVVPGWVISPLARSAATALLLLGLSACGTLHPPQPEPVSEPAPPAPPTFTPVSFASGGVELDATARSSIRRIASILRSARWAGWPLEVRGHSDSRGGEAANLRLSQLRAEAVARELEFNGIERERMVLVGLGETELLVPELRLDGSHDPDAARSNRRVEILLLDRP